MPTTQQALTVQDIQNAIYHDGSEAFLTKVRDALIQIGKHDPISGQLAEQIAEILLYQQDFSQCSDIE